jgi:hypothetical protein
MTKEQILDFLKNHRQLAYSRWVSARGGGFDIEALHARKTYELLEQIILDIDAADILRQLPTAVPALSN